MTPSRLMKTPTGADSARASSAAVGPPSARAAASAAGGVRSKKPFRMSRIRSVIVSRGSRERVRRALFVRSRGRDGFVEDGGGDLGVLGVDHQRRGEPDGALAAAEQQQPPPEGLLQDALA